jgi:hypothetical protein
MTGVRLLAEAGKGFFSLCHGVQTGSGAYQASYPMCKTVISAWVKRPGREADHSPPSSVEVKNAWSYTSTPSICLHDVVFSYAQGQLYLCLTTTAVIWACPKMLRPNGHYGHLQMLR